MLCLPSVMGYLIMEKLISRLLSIFYLNKMISRVMFMSYKVKMMIAYTVWESDTKSYHHLSKTKTNLPFGIKIIAICAIISITTV